MNTTYKKYWLRGVGVASAFFLLFVGGVYVLDSYHLSFERSFAGRVVSWLISIFIYLPAQFTEFLVPFVCKDTGMFSCFGHGIVIFSLLILLEIWILGAILGWIYGKIKEKRG